MAVNGVATVAAPTAALAAGHQEFLFPCVTPYYEEPLVLVGGKGARVADAEGRDYLDLFSGILTTSIGHCHPEVNARVTQQLGTLGHTSTLYVTEKQVEVARRLADLAPGGLKKSFFTNSGTEANETAIMLACLYTGNREVIALRQGYAGRSFLATEVTGHAPWRPLPSSVAGIKHARPPYAYRCPFGTPCDDSCIDAFVDELVEVIDTTTTGRPAALIVEPIQGVAGYNVLPPAYLRRAADVIRSYGGLFISDEVQTGFGRTGAHWFGVEHAGVEPDIMTMAKGIANGFPVGATIATEQIADAWTSKTISTYGGNPISMAAAEATIDVMVREDTPVRSSERGAQLRAGLGALAREHDWIGDVRGMGLMQALELVEDPWSKEPSPAKAVALLEAAKEEGLLVGIGGLHGNVLRVGPSMLVTGEEIADGLARLDRACRRVSASS